jgi:hypothetical protein
MAVRLTLITQNRIFRREEPALQGNKTRRIAHAEAIRLQDHAVAHGWR